MAQNSNLDIDEIDLRELFAALWAHKIIIVLITILFIFLSGYYSVNAKKIFTASAVFQIEETNTSSGFNISREMGALASLAGLASGGKASNKELLLERVKGREFIIKLKESYSLDRDTFLNTYNPDYKDPFWKAVIKKILGWGKTDLEKSAIIENNIINNYRKNVNLNITDAGAIEIYVKHIDPDKAFSYANKIMEEIRQLVEGESVAAQELRLAYLSETLADALQEMENAQENLKNYALKNSMMAQENFITDSLKLDQIRMEKRKVSEIADLLSVIENLIATEKLDASLYESLRSSHPLVDDIDFRRILGMSETISAWSWPDLETIQAVSATLRDRNKRLDIDINNIEENAKIYATSVEDLAKLKRDATIAEATYKVLIEQVKSQSLAAGFQPNTFKVFEFATKPLSPSSPKRKSILIFGAILGVLLASYVSWINAKRKGVYYTRSSLLTDARAELAFKSKSIRRLSRKSLSEIILLIAKRRMVTLDEAILQLKNKRIIYVLNSGGYPTASNAAHLLAIQSAQSGRNVLLCDTTGQSKKQIEKNSTSDNSDSSTVKMGDNISLLMEADGASFFLSTKFSATIKDLTNRFDQVILCSSARNAQLGFMALAEFDPALVVISSLRKTRKADIKNIISRQHIDILFYD